MCFGRHGSSEYEETLLQRITMHPTRKRTASWTSSAHADAHELVKEELRQHRAAIAARDLVLSRQQMVLKRQLTLNSMLMEVIRDQQSAISCKAVRFLVNEISSLSAIFMTRTLSVSLYRNQGNNLTGCRPIGLFIDGSEQRAIRTTEARRNGEDERSSDHYKRPRTSCCQPAGETEVLRLRSRVAALERDRAMVLG